MPNTRGVLAWADMLKWLNLNSGFFETSAYTFEEQMPVVVGNFDGAGISAGNLQYNYAYGNRLNELFTYMFTNHRTVVEQAFGIETAKFSEFETATLTYTQQELINWGDSLTDWVNDAEGKKMKDNWATLIGNVLVTQECIDKYLAMEEQYYIPIPLDLFKQMPVKSRAALASFVDLNINRGRFYGINTLLNDFDAIEADTTLTDSQKEAKKIEQINNRGNDRTNAIDSNYWKERRDCMAFQGGTYYGNIYDPETQFNINQEPAIKEKLDSMSINLGSMSLDNVYYGATPIKSVYLGATLVGNNPEPYTTSKVPQTQFRTNPNSYLGLDKSLTAITLNSGQPLWVDVQNWVAARTYYTTDGTTPTTNSAVYHENLSFTEPVILKTLTVSEFGVAEPVKTLDISIATSSGYRYVRYIGHGDDTGITSRLVELQALEGTTNRLAGLVPISGETPSGGGPIEKVTDGAINYTSGEYPFWWTGEGVPTLIYDMGASYPVDSMLVAMYSPDFDPRQTQFIVQVSSDNTNWVTVADYSANTTVQPTSGFTFTI